MVPHDVESDDFHGEEAGRFFEQTDELSLFDIAQRVLPRFAGNPIHEVVIRAYVRRFDPCRSWHSSPPAVADLPNAALQLRPSICTTSPCFLIPIIY